MGTRRLIRLAPPVAALMLLLGACSGPRVTVTDVALEPGPQRGYYRVAVKLGNTGGPGEVKLTVRLRNRASGAVLSQDRGVGVRPGDQVDMVVDLAAPPAEYTVEAEVEYPPR